MFFSISGHMPLTRMRPSHIPVLTFLSLPPQRARWAPEAPRGRGRGRGRIRAGRTRARKLYCLSLASLQRARTRSVIWRTQARLSSCRHALKQLKGSMKSQIMTANRLSHLGRVRSLGPNLWKAPRRRGTCIKGTEAKADVESGALRV